MNNAVAGSKMSPTGNKSNTKGSRKPSEWLSILIVPEGGIPRRYRVKTLWLKIGATVVGLVFLLIVVAGFSYTTLLNKALDRDHLLAENARLTAENKKIAKLARDVEESRQSLSRIVKSLGGHLDLSEHVSGDTL